MGVSSSSLVSSPSKFGPEEMTDRPTALAGVCLSSFVVFGVGWILSGSGLILLRGVVGLIIFERARRPTYQPNQPPGWRDLLASCLCPSTDRPTDRPRSLISFVFVRIFSALGSVFAQPGRVGGVLVCVLTQPTDRPPPGVFSAFVRIALVGFSPGWCGVLVVFSLSILSTDLPKHLGTSPPVPCPSTDRPTYLPRVVRVSFVSGSVSSFGRPCRVRLGGGFPLCRLPHLGPALTERPTGPPCSLFRFFFCCGRVLSGLVWGVVCECSHFPTCRPTYPAIE